MTNLENKKAKAPAAAPAKAASSGLKSDNIFSLMGAYLDLGEGKDAVAKVQATFCFEITPKKGAKPVAFYGVDMKNGNGKVTKGNPGKVDATFNLTDADFDKMCNGKLNPQMAFMQGKMKIRGNLAKATKFTPELFPAPTPENFAKYTKGKL